MPIIDRSAYHRLLVEKCDQHAPIHLIYEYLTGNGTKFGGGRQENVSCPWHGTRGDVRPSATIYPGSNAYYCHVCHDKPLNAIDFVKTFNDCSFYEAIRWLESAFGFKAFDESFTFTDDLLQELEFHSELTDEGFRDELNSFEKNLIQQKEYYSFINYCKLFYIFDFMRKEYFNDNIPLKDSYLKFEKIKNKAESLLRQKLQEEEENV